MLYWILIFIPMIFFGNTFILSTLSSSYNLRLDSISSLVHTNYGSWQTANFIICGIFVTGLAMYLYFRKKDSSRNSISAIAENGVFGTSLLLLGIFPTNKVGQTTIAGQVHGSIFVISVYVQACLQLRVAYCNHPSLLSKYLWLSSFVTVSGLPAMIIFPEYRGLIQRVLVGAIVVWVTLISLRPAR